MKARDQNHTGFTVESGCEGGRNISKIQAPRRSWSVTPAIKMRELLDREKITLPSCSKMSKFSLFPYNNILWCRILCPKSKLRLSCGSQSTQERTEVVRKVCAAARCLQGTGDGAAVALRACACSCLHRWNCFWNYLAFWIISLLCMQCSLLWAKLSFTLRFVRRPIQIWLYIPAISMEGLSG